MKSYGYKNFFNMLPNYESGCHMKFPALYVCELKKQKKLFQVDWEDSGSEAQYPLPKVDLFEEAYENLQGRLLILKLMKNQ